MALDDQLNALKVFLCWVTVPLGAATFHRIILKIPFLLLGLIPIKPFHVWYYLLEMIRVRFLCC